MTRGQLFLLLLLRILLLPLPLRFHMNRHEWRRLALRLLLWNCSHVRAGNEVGCRTATYPDARGRAWNNFGDAKVGQLDGLGHLG